MQNISVGEKNGGIFERCEDEQHGHHGDQGFDVAVELGAGLDRVHRLVRIRDTPEHREENTEV